MSIKNSLAPQIKDLLSGVSDHGSQHLTEIETDLIQTNILLNEAIAKLGASFMAIHEEVAAQQEIVNSLLETAAIAPEKMAELKAKSAQIEQHVNAAVTGLQFQDMTTQLIGRTMRRVIGFRNVLDALGTSSVGMLAEVDRGKIAALLDLMNETLKTQSSSLEKELWKTVHQTHMESGDIELF